MRFYLLSQLNVLAADSVEPTDSSDISLTDFFWIPLIIGLSIFMLLTTWRCVRRSQEHDNLTVQERVSNVMPKGNTVYSQISDLMAELANLSRQINGQIDTRIAKLDQLNAHADETINRGHTGHRPAPRRRPAWPSTWILSFCHAAADGYARRTRSR